MINRSVARRYARALADLVDKDLTATAAKLSGFAELVKSHETLAQVLSNPAFSLEERYKVLDRMLAQLGWAAPLDRFLRLLVERHRVIYLGAIAEEFSAMVDQAEGRVRVQVHSATELDAAELAKLKQALSAGLEKQVIVEQGVQPDLIAGMAVRVGSLVVDGSLRSQLTRLKDSLART